MPAKLACLMSFALLIGCRPSPGPEQPPASPAPPAPAVDPALVDFDWDAAKAEQLAQPPKRWESNATDTLDRIADLSNWTRAQDFLVPEIEPAIREWIRDASDSLSTTVTNVSGAQYRITGRKHATGIEASVQFIGNTNWE